VIVLLKPFLAKLRVIQIITNHVMHHDSTDNILFLVLHYYYDAHE